MKERLSKGDLMRLIYSKEELTAIDSAIPMQVWETHMPVCHVMNYNGNNRIYGELQNLFEVAKERGIDVSEYENLKHSDNRYFPKKWNNKIK